MTHFHILTIFPHVFESYFKESIIWRAQKKKIIKIHIVNLRDFTTDKHQTVDDRPFGGGPGMVLKPEPILKSVQKITLQLRSPKFYSLRLSKGKNFDGLRSGNNLKIILLSPSGKQFNQIIARNWAKKYNHFILICGHYEGIDARVKKILKPEEISIGPYVLTGGELAAMAVTDAITRHIPGALGKKESIEEKREGIGIPVYTRPEILEWRGKKYKTPKVLLSGHHQKIKEWRNIRSTNLRHRKT